MCFSATASFVTGSVLLSGGVASAYKSKQSVQMPFALIPLLFGLQQFCEGFLWLALEHDGYAQWASAFTISFLFFAQVVWPIWVPYSMWRLEKNDKRNKILLTFLIIGGIVSVYLAYCIFSLPTSAEIKGNHITYVLDFPHTDTYYLAVFYLIPILLSPIVSSVKWMSGIGLMIFASFLITKFFFEGYIISVWCFFAAIISIGVLLIIYKNFKEAD